ncbi:MAG: M28 family peptidase [bacterium]
MWEKQRSLLAAVCLIAAACSSSTQDLSVREIVEELADDALLGRDNQSEGAALARTLLIQELSRFAEPIAPEESGEAQYTQEFDTGTNVLAIIPGGELADEFVVIGAHYDGTGNHCEKENCQDATDEDQIFNAATDNATGVAIAIEIARSIARDSNGGPRRTVILALWDAEEDGLVGSRYFVANPIVPLGQIKAYVNFDIQGANLMPELARTTILVGAETGGNTLEAAAASAIQASTLDTLRFSLIFGQNRSDHASFVAGGVPAVFFTDANSGCYHSVKDDISVVDFDKLNQQRAAAEALTRDLVETDTPPVFTTGALATYQDAQELLRVVARAEPDFFLLGPEQAAQTSEFLVVLGGIVEAGFDSFDQSSAGVILGGAANLVTALRDVRCEPFFPAE